jgi:hypothetical protein
MLAARDDAAEPPRDENDVRHAWIDVDDDASDRVAVVLGVLLLAGTTGWVLAGAAFAHAQFTGDYYLFEPSCHKARPLLGVLGVVLVGLSTATAAVMALRGFGRAPWVPVSRRAAVGLGYLVLAVVCVLIALAWPEPVLDPSKCPPSGF